jgi:hypothetical protein
MQVYIKITPYTLKNLRAHIGKEASVISKTASGLLRLHMRASNELIEAHPDDLAGSEDAVLNALRRARVDVLRGPLRGKNAYFAAVRTVCAEKRRFDVLLTTNGQNSGVTGKTLFRVDAGDIGPICIPHLDLTVNFQVNASKVD